MKKIFLFSCYLITLGLAAFSANSATRTAVAPNPAVSGYVSQQNYATMQPFLNNAMQQELNPGGTQYGQGPTTIMTHDAAQSSIASFAGYTQGAARTGTQSGATARSATTGGIAPAATYKSARTSGGTSVAASNNSGGRRVVARSGTVSSTGGASAVARGATNSAAASNNSGGRRVVARGATTSSGATASVARSARGDNSTYTQTVRSAQGIAQANAPDTSGVTTERCLADYTTCMDSYCYRSEMLYARCYCSPKLAQIDSRYQQSIRDLTEQILIAQGGGNMTRAELEDYWQKVFGDYTGENSLASLNKSLDIDWADAESRTQGQTAFATGHNYCMNHLKACYYMAEELRGIYRSTIARDCKTYETYLNRLETAAEAILEQLTR